MLLYLEKKAISESAFLYPSCGVVAPLDISVHLDDSQAGEAFLTFSSCLALFPENGRRKTRGRKLNSKKDSWTQILSDPKSSPVHPALRMSPASRVQPLANSHLLATLSRALTQNTAGLQADVQAEPPTGILPQTFREQPPESQVVSWTAHSDSSPWTGLLGWHLLQKY